MAVATQTKSAAGKESFAALLDQSLGTASGLEGTVIKGVVLAVENDQVLIDVGLKSEGRVALKEFAATRRAVLEASRAEARDELVERLKEGQILQGVVKNITDYGAFVDLGGVDGLLHVTDIAWRRINHPSEALHIGQTVKVQVIRFNPETQRISLGMNQPEADPWEGVELEYPSR